MFKSVYKHLKASNFDCYSIGQHKGLCEKEYIVIKNNTPRSLNEATINEEVELLLYYPIGEYSKVFDFINSIKEAMKGTRLKDNFIQFPIIIDDDKKAYFTKLSYENRRKKVL